jgi:hypothetical protein
MENQRLIKSLSEKMCLLSAIRNENGEEWTFKVRGKTNNIYDQHLSATKYSCSCPDHTGKNTFCKHLLFLVVRAAKQYDLGCELTQRPKTTWKKSAYNACSVSWIKCLSHLISATVEPSVDIDGICAICCEDLKSASTCASDLVECSKTCHNHFHKECIDRWLEHGSTCPTCRTQWSLNNENSGSGSKRSNTSKALTE